MTEASVGSSEALVLEGWDSKTDSDKISRWLEILEECKFDNPRDLSFEREGTPLQENVFIDGNLVDSDMIRRHRGSVTERFQMVEAMVRHADKRKRDQLEQACPPTPSSVVFAARIRKAGKHDPQKERKSKHSGRKTVSSVSEALQKYKYREEKRPRLVLKGKATQAEGKKDDREIPSGECHYINRVDTRHPKKKRWTKGEPLTLTYIKEETPSRDDGFDPLEKIEEKSLVCPSIDSINEEEKERFVRYRKRKADLLDGRMKRKSTTHGKEKAVSDKKCSDQRIHKDDFFTNDYHYHDYDYSMNDEEPVEVDEEEEEEEAPWFDQVCTVIPTASNEKDLEDGLVDDDVGLDGGIDGWVEVDHPPCPYLCHRLCGGEHRSCSKTCDEHCNHSRETSDEPFDKIRYGEEGKGVGTELIAEANLYDSSSRVELSPPLH